MNTAPTSSLQRWAPKFLLTLLAVQWFLLPYPATALAMLGVLVLYGRRIAPALGPARIPAFVALVPFAALAAIVLLPEEPRKLVLLAKAILFATTPLLFWPLPRWWAVVRADVSLFAVFVVGFLAPPVIGRLNGSAWSSIALVLGPLLRGPLQWVGYDLLPCQYLGAAKEVTPVALCTNRALLFVLPECSGAQGISLFFTVLSAVLLLRWEEARGLRVGRLYGLGVLTMGAVNWFRIVSFFVFADAFGNGVLAKQSDTLKSMHDGYGIILYGVTLGLFVRWLLRRLDHLAAQPTS